MSEVSGSTPPPAEVSHESTSPKEGKAEQTKAKELGEKILVKKAAQVKKDIEAQDPAQQKETFQKDPSLAELYGYVSLKEGIPVGSTEQFSFGKPIDMILSDGSSASVTGITACQEQGGEEVFLSSITKADGSVQENVPFAREKLAEAQLSQRADTISEAFPPEQRSLITWYANGATEVIPLSDAELSAIDSSSSESSEPKKEASFAVSIDMILQSEAFKKFDQAQQEEWKKTLADQENITGEQFQHFMEQVAPVPEALQKSSEEIGKKLSELQEKLDKLEEGDPKRETYQSEITKLAAEKEVLSQMSELLQKAKDEKYYEQAHDKLTSGKISAEKAEEIVSSVKEGNFDPLFDQFKELQLEGLSEAEKAAVSAKREKMMKILKATGKYGLYTTGGVLALSALLALVASAIAVAGTVSIASGVAKQ